LRKVKLSNYAKSNAISYHTAWNYHNVEDDKEDLMQDFVSIITSFVARLYAQLLLLTQKWATIPIKKWATRSISKIQKKLLLG